MNCFCSGDGTGQSFGFDGGGKYRKGCRVVAGGAVLWRGPREPANHCGWFAVAPKHVTPAAPTASPVGARRTHRQSLPELRVTSASRPPCPCVFLCVATAIGGIFAAAPKLPWKESGGGGRRVAGWGGRSEPAALALAALRLPCCVVNVLQAESGSAGAALCGSALGFAWLQPLGTPRQPSALQLWNCLRNRLVGGNSGCFTRMVLPPRPVPSSQPSGTLANTPSPFSSCPPPLPFAHSQPGEPSGVTWAGVSQTKNVGGAAPLPHAPSPSPSRPLSLQPPRQDRFCCSAGTCGQVLAGRKGVVGIFFLRGGGLCALTPICKEVLPKFQGSMGGKPWSWMRTP